MRRLLGSSLGRCPRIKVIKGYIAIELQLGEVERCRRLYEKFTSLWPTHVQAWVAFAELERSLAEEERAAAVLELSVSQPVLDVPEVAWKAYIDFEIARGELGNARALYERLLQRSKHAKVWLSYATFEGAQVGDAALARAVYAAAYAHFKGVGVAGREERVLMLEAWLAFERAVVQDEIEHGGDGSANAQFLRAVQAKVPSRVVRKRELTAADGSSLGWEEYYDWVFPDDETKPVALKLLEMAHKWRAGGGSIKAALSGGGADADDAERASSAGGSGVDGDGAVAAGRLAGSIRRRSDDGAGLDDGNDGDASLTAQRFKRMRPSEGQAALDQSCADEAETPNANVDTVFQEEVEREMEARVRAAQSSSDAPRDMYCEEDVGEAADRDTVA
jgi:crooked neck